MPYYYLISEVPDEKDEPIYDIRNYKKPETFNLLLPSIHNSREDNILVTDSDASEAVRNLLASCRDSASWPSTKYCDIADGPVDVTPSCHEDPVDLRPETVTGNVYERNSDLALPENTPKPQVFAKYKPPFWAYDAIRPEVLEAARALFYERKRQQAMYESFPSWSSPSGAPRLPSEYELFTAWACLPRSDKLTYVSEVSGSHSPNLAPRDSLATQRAVTSLLASCPDSSSWPSFQFSRLQAQQHTSAPPPHHHRPHPYHHHHYPHQQQQQQMMLQSPLVPFRLD